MAIKYDDFVPVEINRDGERMTVPFCDLLAGDILTDPRYPTVIVEDGAHYSGDASYDGYLFYGTDEHSYFPEDFGAEALEGGD